MHRILVLSILIINFFFNLSAQNTFLEVFVYDDYTEKPLDSTLVSLLRHGVVIDSAFTNVNGIAHIHLPATSVKDQRGLPSSISISHNYPNPFREDTNIEIGVPESQTMTVSVFNILGQRVANEQIPVSPGYYTLNLSMGHLPTGVYFLRIDGIEAQAIKLIKLGMSVHQSKPVFSISPSINPGRGMVDKTAEDEYTLRVKNDRYDVYETAVSIPEEREIDVPLARNNEVKFILLDGEMNQVSKNLEIVSHNYQTTITTPGTLTLKSGSYNLIVEIYVDEVYLEQTIKIPSIDTTLTVIYVKDIDGNVYQTVKIGRQLWMVENLRTTSYRNGDEISTGLDTTAWQNTTSGAYAVYPHDNVDGINSVEEMLEAYGALYNWYAVDDPRGLCPKGWGVPSDDEWKQLEIVLGMSQQEADKSGRRGYNEGGSIKSTQTEPGPHPRWNRPNTGATNESGWSGFPGGGRYYYGRFYNFGFFGDWWSSTEHSDRYAWYRFLSYFNGSIFRWHIVKQGGFSIRCVKD